MQTTEYIHNVYYAFNMHVPIECRAGASETHKLRYAAILLQYAFICIGIIRVHNIILGSFLHNAG